VVVVKREAPKVAQRGALSRVLRIISSSRTMYVLSPAVVLALWELCADKGVVDKRFYGSPSEVGSAVVSMIRSGEYFTDVRISVTRILVGYSIGVLLGCGVGLLMGLSRMLRNILTPLVAAAFSVPKIALLPLLLLLFGIGEVSKIALVAIGVFFIATYNTLGGVLNLPTFYQDVATSFGMNRRKYFRLIALPGSLPHIFTGLKVSMGTAILLIVAAEFVGATNGIGYRVWASWQIFAVDQMFVGLVTLAILGTLGNLGMDWLERKVLPWR
jgi:NitT/TauT family transport system permease protein